MRFVPRALLIALVFSAPLARAQEAPQAAFEAANNIYNSGDYPAAVAAYEAVLRDYPTSTIVPNAQVQLAFAYYLTGENQKSLDTIAKYRDGLPKADPGKPAKPSELSELADLLGKPLDPAEKDKALGIVRTNGGVAAAIALAETYVDVAASACAVLPNSAATEALRRAPGALLDSVR